MSVLKMEASVLFVKLVIITKSTRRLDPEDNNLNFNRHVQLISLQFSVFQGVTGFPLPVKLFMAHATSPVTYILYGNFRFAAT